MDSLPTWAWWLVVAGLLLSPVLAFLIAILVEIFIEVLKEGGLAAVITLVVAGLTGRLVLRRLRMRPTLNHTVEDQA
jgi:branched-subunit amino acid ABC-type transport system permease component